MSMVSTANICGSARTSLGSVISKLASTFCASGESRPPHTLLRSRVCPSMIAILASGFESARKRAKVEPAGPAPTTATSKISLVIFATVALYVLKKIRRLTLKHPAKLVKG